MQLHQFQLATNADLAVELIGNCSEVFMSESEYNHLLSEIPELAQGPRSSNQFQNQISWFVTKPSSAWVLTSLGGSSEVTFCPMDPVVDPTGAGDSFAGGTVAGLDLTNDVTLAARFGGLAASICVSNWSSRATLATLKNRSPEP